MTDHTITSTEGARSLAGILSGDTLFVDGGRPEVRVALDGRAARCHVKALPSSFSDLRNTGPLDVARGADVIALNCGDHRAGVLCYGRLVADQCAGESREQAHVELRDAFNWDALDRSVVEAHEGCRRVRVANYARGVGRADAQLTAEEHAEIELHDTASLREGLGPWYGRGICRGHSRVRWSGSADRFSLELRDDAQGFVQECDGDLRFIVGARASLVLELAGGKAAVEITDEARAVVGSGTTVVVKGGTPRITASGAAKITILGGEPVISEIGTDIDLRDRRPATART